MTPMADDEQLGLAGLLDQRRSNRAGDRRDAHPGSGGGLAEDAVDDLLSCGFLSLGHLGVVDGDGHAVAGAEPARGLEDGDHVLWCAAAHRFLDGGGQRGARG